MISAIERKAIEKKYSKVRAHFGDYGGGQEHGKLIKILKNTHCHIYICIFETGNEFITRREYLRLLYGKNDKSKNT